MKTIKDNGEDYNKPFPTRLRALLDDENGISPLGKPTTQTELAQAFHDSGMPVTRQTISLYANGTTKPDFEKFKFIADYFKVSYDYLLGESNAIERENFDFVKKTGLMDNAISTLAAIKEEVDEDLFGLYYMKKILALLNYVLYDIINLTDFIGPIITYISDLKSYKLIISILDSLEKIDVLDPYQKTVEKIELQEKTISEMTDDEDVRCFLIKSINEPYTTIEAIRHRIQNRFKFSIWRMSENLIECIKEMSEILLENPEVDESTGIGLGWYGELVTKNAKQSKKR